MSAKLRRFQEVRAGVDPAALKVTDSKGVEY